MTSCLFNRTRRCPASTPSDPSKPDPTLLAADSRERGVFEALGLTLAGLAASAVLAGAASAHDVIDVADISTGLLPSGRTLAWESPAAAT
jgi:hypothetical protein